MSARGAVRLPHHADHQTRTGTQAKFTESEAGLMSIVVRIPTPLRGLTGDQDVVDGAGASLTELVADLEQRYPGIAERVVDEGGEMRRFVNIFVNGEDVRFLDGMATSISEGDEVSIVPAVAGG